MRILLISDAWHPQVNGVVRTLSTVRAHLEKDGHQVCVISPDLFKTVPCPTYPEIRLAFLPGRKIAKIYRSFQPDAVHIATEGPLGLAARNFCKAQHIPFTTAFHTRFPEYIETRFAIPSRWTYKLMRWFHNAAEGTMVATRGLGEELRANGFKSIKLWSRGVDLTLFHPQAKKAMDFPRPIHLFVGRVAPEKNIEAFLKLDLPGSKVVIGDGPEREILSRKYPLVKFLGAKQGADLAAHYASADVFVFPSRTDTFGLVMLEALASGVPVAAFPVSGPKDVLTDPKVGALDDDLSTAITRALKCAPADCRTFAEQFSWQACSDLFLSHLVPITAQETSESLEKPTYAIKGPSSS